MSPHPSSGASISGLEYCFDREHPEVLLRFDLAVREAREVLAPVVPMTIAEALERVSSKKRLCITEALSLGVHWCRHAEPLQLQPPSFLDAWLLQRSVEASKGQRRKWDVEEETVERWGVRFSDIPWHRPPFADDLLVLEKCWAALNEVVWARQQVMEVARALFESLSGTSLSDWRTNPDAPMAPLGAPVLELGLMRVFGQVAPPIESLTELGHHLSLVPPSPHVGLFAIQDGVVPASWLKGETSLSKEYQQRLCQKLWPGDILQRYESPLSDVLAGEGGVVVLRFGIPIIRHMTFIR